MLHIAVHKTPTIHYCIAPHSIQSLSLTKGNKNMYTCMKELYYARLSVQHLDVM